MNILIPTMGSSGDVFPLLSIGREMQTRGHQVYIIANPVFKELVSESGLKFIALGSEQDYFKTVNDPDLWKPERSFNAIVQHGILPLMPLLFDIIRKFSPDDSLIAAPVMMIAGRLEKC